MLTFVVIIQLILYIINFLFIYWLIPTNDQVDQAKKRIELFEQDFNGKLTEIS
jgi:hypothetical protein